MSVTTLSLASAVALTAAGWLPTGAKWDQNRYPSVPYCITANATNTNVNAQGQQTAVLNSIRSWVSTGAGGTLSCTTYQASQASYPCSVGVNTRDQRFNIFWERNWSNGSQAIGVTWTVGNGRSCGSVVDDTGRSHNLGCKFDSDIEFNDRDFFWTNTGRSGTDIESISVHEYGHFIGMDHCSDNNTCSAGRGVMYAAYIGGSLRTLFNDDVQGGCAMYPGSQGGFAWPCTADSQCNSNICASAGTDGYCSQTCGSCPTGFVCDVDPANSGRMVCLRDDGLNRGVCQQCQAGVQGACRDNGICMSGLPDNRCITPCGTGRSCDAQFQCLTVQFQGGGTGDYCFPRSSDCDDLNNFSELQMGQQCNGSVPCAGGLTCVGICAASCDSMSCPQGYGCERFQNGNSYCLPSVNEGQSCEGLKSCAVGPCLTNPANQVATCYLDCAGNASACNNAQTCNTYNLSGGGQVSICEPPGVPPNPPDAGVIEEDAGPSGTDGGVNPRDSGVSPRDSGVQVPDAGTGNNTCACDTTSSCDQGSSGDCACDPNCFCGCDLTYSCDPDPSSGGECACDPECRCECDLTFSCDLGCEFCDPECRGGGTTCTCTSPTAEGAPTGAAWLAAAFVGLVLLRRRRRG